uniref:DUF4129 domain-containing protein n=1 Tax=Streptomyces sp. NBC_00093 TaxID=2975649 RepID=A0AAU2AI24_9ACTN
MQEITRQEALLEDVREVYADDARLAFNVAAASARANALRPIRHEGRIAASDYELAAQTAFALRSTADSGSVLHDAYRYKNLGYDLPRRLADVQRDEPKLYELVPGATMSSGDEWARWGLVFAALAGVAVITGVLAANVVRPRSLRTPPGPDRRRVVRDLEVIPQPAVTGGGWPRVTAELHLFVVALLVLLPLGGVYMAGSEQRARPRQPARRSRTAPALWPTARE